MNTPLNHAGNDYAARLAAQSRTPSEQKVDPKIYFHHHNYAKFHFDFGGSLVKTISFANHRYITDDKREQDQLDLVADMPGTFIYTITDSDVERAMLQEIAQEGAKDVLRTAQAAAAVAGQVFDPNAPILPIAGSQVTVQHMSQTPGLKVAPAHVGLQHSFAGTQANEQLSAVATNTATQERAPSATEAAAQRLASMTNIAKAQ